MAQKELSLTKLGICIYCILSFGCSHPNDIKKEVVFENIDVAAIPNDTIFQTHSTLSLLNGVYFLNNKPYSGFIQNMYAPGLIKSIGSYFKGKQHGATKTYYYNGKIESIRNYKDGIGYGRHVGYWKNGNQKFDFIYYNDKREGIQKQWYENGNKYYELSFVDDKENGMQKAWRENGKPYINYEVKDGLRYGLQKAALCYTLKNGQTK
jgi:antitoxin component YwqK of YwqJK toxin-antitoxin module